MIMVLTMLLVSLCFATLSLKIFGQRWSRSAQKGSGQMMSSPSKNDDLSSAATCRSPGVGMYLTSHKLLRLDGQSDMRTTCKRSTWRLRQTNCGKFEAHGRCQLSKSRLPRD